LDLSQADYVTVRSRRVKRHVKKLGFSPVIILHTKNIRQLGIEGYSKNGYSTPNGLGTDLYEKYAEKGLCDLCPSETCWECF